MNKNIILIGLLVLLLSSCSKEIKLISPEQQVILTNQYNQTWTPSEEETQDALKAIYPYLTTIHKQGNSPIHYGNVEGVLNDYKQYYVQFIGIEVDGKKIIRCNFFKRFDDGLSHNWKRSVIVVHDGGHNFWQIQYISSTKKCQNLMINGEA